MPLVPPSFGHLCRRSTASGEAQIRDFTELPTLPFILFTVSLMDDLVRLAAPLKQPWDAKSTPIRCACQGGTAISCIVLP